MRTRFLSFLIGILLLTGCATVQDKIALESRISRLEQTRNRSEQDVNQIQTELQKIGTTWNSKDQDFAGQYASLRAETRKLMEEVQILNGRIDESEFTIGQLSSKKGELEVKLQGLEVENQKAAKRIAELEHYLGIGTSLPKNVPPAGKKPPSDHPVNSNKDSENQEPENGLYSQAKKALDDGEFESARSGFQKFITMFPTSENADNAQFWIGETYYREAWYEKAILEYEEVKKKFPKGNKIPSALLKQGMSFQQLNEKANARLILEELVNRFPNSNEADIAKKILKNI
ncbi:MAG: tol-pal system protein YbgF [Pseudomonadota bacterium]